MIKYIFLVVGLIVCSSIGFAQNNNGKIDLLEEIVTRKVIDMPTPDGATFETNTYMPIFADSHVVRVNIPTIGLVDLEIIPKNVQYIHYPELNGGANSNPYQLPVVLNRNPYNKETIDILGFVFAIFGYAAFFQDARGLYGSTDIWIPLYTDGWDKTPYSDFVPTDLLGRNYNKNPSEFEDGLYTLDYVLNDWKRSYDIDDDGQVDFVDKVGNGSVFFFGGSALALPGIQMGLSRKINPNGPGLKGFLNLIAASEFYNHLIYQNGMFKEALLDGWLGGQVRDFEDNSLVNDTSYNNKIHTPEDYGYNTEREVLDAMLDLVTVVQIDGKSGVYPNGALREAFDATRASVDENGNGDLFGTYNRFSNLDMPFYNISGWWDIFLSGQIETWRETKYNISKANGNHKRQKLVIGPWQHYYPVLQNAGDLVFPDNVKDVLGVTAIFKGEADFDLLLSILDLNIKDLLESEMFGFIRETTNYNSYKNIGEPQIRIPKSKKYQEVGDYLVQLPASDFVTSMKNLFNFILGQEDLEGYEVALYKEELGDTVLINRATIEIPALPPIISDLFGQVNTPLENFPKRFDIENTADVRMYIVGPEKDGVPFNRGVGNYWMESDTFPIKNGINWNKLFLHSNGTLTANAPDSIENKRTYLHDPYNPVFTIGGNNLEVKTPTGQRSMGPVKISKPAYVPITLEHPGVVSFETTPFKDSMTIIGYPEVKIYASSLPEGAGSGDPTDTDFIVRLVDVYPGGDQYFITEGSINARAREYVKSIALDAENDDAPFSNLAADKVYEFHFKTLPIGYAFGRNHKLKILISSSNHPRYQSNPNIPIEDNEFFRWPVGSDETYTYKGVEYQPRKANNSIHFAPEYPSQIILPVYGKEIAPCEVVTTMSVDIISDSSVNLSWEVPLGIDEFNVETRVLGTTNWVSNNIIGSSLTLNDLETNTQYEWRVNSICAREEMLMSKIDTFLLGDLLTSIVDERLKRAFNVYPNPISDRLNISFKEGFWEGEIQIYTTDGRKVYEEMNASIGAQSKILNLNHLENSSYILKLRSKGAKKIAAFPFVKMLK